MIELDDEMKARVRAAAELRTKCHDGSSTQKVLSRGHDYVGAYGEVCCAKVFGHEPNLEHLPQGDGGIDGYLSLTFSYDVKTSRTGLELLHPCPPKRWADVYILARYCDDQDAAELIGWTWGKTLQAAPTKEVQSGLNHYIAARDLNPMRTLFARAGVKETA